MTPPTTTPHSFTIPFRLPSFLCVPLFALILTGFSATAHASLATQPARPALSSGLKNLQESLTLRERLVEAGLAAIGTRYVWGGEDDDGFDCSGLTLHVYHQVAGVNLPRTAREQRAAGKIIHNKEDIKPGDLVFFYTRQRGVVSHVGIYIGNNEFVHAPRRGTKVRVEKMSVAYWNKRYLGARRYIEQTPAPSVVAHANS